MLRASVISVKHVKVDVHFKSENQIRKCFPFYHLNYYKTSLKI